MPDWLRNRADIVTAKLGGDRNLPTNQKDPPHLINCNEIRSGFQNSRFVRNVLNGNWFEQQVLGSEKAQAEGGSLSSLAAFGMDDKPEKPVYYNTRGKYHSEYSANYISFPKHRSIIPRLKTANASDVREQAVENPLLDFNGLNSTGLRPGTQRRYWKHLRNAGADLDFEHEPHDFYLRTASDFGSRQQRRLHKADGEKFMVARHSF